MKLDLSLRSGRVGLLTGALVGLVAFACGGTDSGSSSSGGSSGTSSSGTSGTTSSSGTSGASSSGTSSGTSGASSSGTSGASSSGTSGTSGASGGSSGTSGDAGAKVGTVFTLVFENHDYKEIVGSANAPYFNSLIAKYGLATNYADSGTHPSLPNYLTMISGEPQYAGIVDLDPTQICGIGCQFPVDKPNLGTQLQAAGVKWRSYQESMGTACNLTGAGSYAPKHDPFLYFKDQQTGAGGLCASTNVDYGQFAADLAAGTYRFMWITPNLTSDGHDPSNDPVAALKASDTWAQAEIGKIMASTAYKNGGVIFITWDEAENRSGAGSADQVPMIIVSENIVSAGFQSAKKYSHKSYLATVEDILAMPRLTTVASEPNMLEFLK
jgi:phosphatidylinositol-3-phosphatase